MITATEDREEDVAGALVVATFVVDGAGALLDSLLSWWHQEECSESGSADHRD